jgi:hypothetical protein
MKKIFILFAGILLSFHGFSQNWLLTGNSGTTPPTNFLGTKDAQRLVFKTDSLERMTILANGNVGVGTSSPVFLFHSYSTSADVQAAVSGTAPSIHFFSGLTASTVSGGRLAFSTGSNDFIGGSVAGDFILMNYDTAHSLIFATNQNTTSGEGMERMRINKIGYIGIDQAAPTARLDVNCATLSGQTNPSNIRLENLQRGSGTVLVIDSNGYVFKSASGQTAIANTPLATDMQSQIEELKSQVQELRALLTSKVPLTAAEANSLHAESATWLGDVRPNPASTSATLEYSLPSGVSAALCQVYSLDGKVVSSIALPASSGKSQIQLATSQLAPGMYIYALIVNGKVLDSKKLAVVR